MSVLGRAAHAFIYDSGAKLTALGIHRLKADPTVQEVSPRTVPVRHQRDNKNQRNPHSIANIPYIKNRVAHAFPIQFPVLYCPWCVRVLCVCVCSNSPEDHLYLNTPTRSLWPDGIHSSSGELSTGSLNYK